MIAILPLIILIVRFNNFMKLTLAELPKISNVELEDMKRFSKIALSIFGVFTVASFVPYALMGGSTANLWSLGITLPGLVIAAVFDLKAERIKTSGAEPVPGLTHWYHIVVSIILPYIGLPWGIVNLCRRQRKSGLTMVIISSIVLLIIILVFTLASSK